MFRQLLEQSKQLTNHIVAPGLTPIDRGLDQIEAQTQRLLRRSGAPGQDPLAAGAQGAAAPAGDDLLYGAGSVFGAGSGAGAAGVGALGGFGGMQASGAMDTSAAAPLDSRTAYMLAKQGFDADRVSQTLAQIDLAHTFEPLQGVPDADIDAFLRNEHENIVSVAIEETKAQVAADFETSFEQRLDRDWTAIKKRIYSEMGHQPSASSVLAGAGDRSLFFQQGLTDMSGMSFSGGSSSMLQPGSSRFGSASQPQQGSSVGGMASAGGIAAHPRHRAFLQVVKAMNDARIRKTPFDPVGAFGRIAFDLAADSQQTMIARYWPLISYMLSGTEKGLAKIPQSHFRDACKAAEDPGMSEQATRYRFGLAKGGRSWLEKSYVEWTAEHVRSQLVELGGMPSVHSEVDALLRIRFMQHNKWKLPWLDITISSGKPFWAHVFTLVRMGLRSQAYEYITRHQGELAKSGDRNFPTYFKAWMDVPDGRLPKAYRDKLLSEWNGGIRDYPAGPNASPKGDMFKYALYKIIGRCEMSSKTIRGTDVIATIEDYIWIHLMLVQEEVLPTDAAHERFTLRDCSLAMQKYGQAGFQNRETWFMVLFLCGEFERAISELATEAAHSADALHFAIALAYYGVLRVPDNPRGIPMSGANLIIRPTTLSTGVAYDVAYFHFAKAIVGFVRTWGQTDPLDTLHYIYLLTLCGAPLDSVAAPSSASASVRSPPTAVLAGRDYARFSHELVCEFVLSVHGRFPEMLGQVRADGSGRTPGHVEVYRSLLFLSTEHDYLQAIVLAAANQAHSESRMGEAIDLYHLCGQYDRVLVILNTILGERMLQQTALMQTDAMDTTASHGFSSLSAATTPQSITKVGTTDAALPVFSIDTDPVESTERFMQFYQSRPTTAASLSAKTVKTSTMLVQLSRFRSLAEQGRDEPALKTVYDLGIFPHSDDIADIPLRVESFGELDEVVARVMPAVMLLTMQCLHNLYRSWNDRRGDGRVEMVRQRAKGLLMFAGHVQYRISGDVFAKMNRLDVEMV
ncbi:Nup93/Nic96-domain-containing protein [Entophlyctis helioformis]|nr:Nup93/Nic96-domain-containing protein [Entophlyctis helioformis]